MSHITKQERRGLEDLFIAIDHSRYDSRIKSFEFFCKSTFKQCREYFFRIIIKK